MTCNKSNGRLNYKRLTPWEISTSVPDCSQCHPKKQRRCQQPLPKNQGRKSRENKHTESPNNFQMIGRRAGFISIKTGRTIYGREQTKIIPITYYRTSPPTK